MTNPANKMAEGPWAVFPDRLFQVSVTDDGTPGGNKSIIANYASRTEFWAASPPTQTFYVKSADIYIQGAGNITANGYGPTIALVNGIELSIRDAANVPQIPPVTVRTTGEWQAVPGTILSTEERGPGDNYLNVIWTFEAAGGSPIVLRPGWRLTVVGHDDFTGLTEHFVTVSGVLLDET